MVKRKRTPPRKRAKPVRTRPATRGAGLKKPRLARKAVRSTRRPAVKRVAKAPRPARKPSARPARRPAKTPRLERERRTLSDVVQSPPSSLDMVRHGTAARSGRADIAHQRRNHTGMSDAITGGDVDVDVEDAYFTGDGAPGGDNPSPDLEVVDDIGRALGVQYEDGEELKGSDKIVERDKHRWEFDPASAEDYKERK